VRTIRFDLRARAEYRQVVEFYKGEGVLIAREFATETRAALDLIASLPQGSSADEEGIRKKVLRKFPYTIVYTLTDDLIEVIAFAHERRKPDYWRTRL
jgi:plasmid stabilization system protein ParE